MFASIRRTIAAAIAPKAAPAPVATNLTAAAYQPAPLVNGRPIPPTNGIRKQTNFEGIEGHLTVETIKGLSSDTLRKTMTGKLVNSNIAQAWQAEVRCTNSRIQNPVLIQARNQKLQDAAEAVAAADSLGYSTELVVENFAYLLTTGVPAPINERNAALLASINGKSVEEIVKGREAKRTAAFASNMEHLQVFLDGVSSCTGKHIDPATGEIIESDAEPVLKGSAAIAALSSAVEFVTTWNDEIRQAAELMLIQHDRSVIEAELKRTAARTNGAAPAYTQAIDDQLLSADGMAAGMQSGK